MNSTWSESSVMTMHEKAPQIEDEILVAAARSGDRNAFDHLTHRHSRRTFCKVYRITKNWQDAEDVLQDSLMKAFLHIHTFESKASFSTWFTTIAINTALMLLRKRRRMSGVTIDATGDEAGLCGENQLRDEHEDPEQLCAREQRAYLLKGAILQLQKGLRNAVELQQGSDLSVKEIAANLGISESAVKSRLNRARKELRSSLRHTVGHSRACCVNQG